ncbi:ribonuclease D [Glycomyces buryatensis]|uniref:Ribonuclease D n=1 Tax=Glycomyces buryatensis TaxID=2570927 RepID=A0A4S8QPQ3_9ACTN|nr:ribonuclease D [Glycomyces buryatensis]
MRFPETGDWITIGWISVAGRAGQWRELGAWPYREQVTDPQPDEPASELLTEPREGMPPLIQTSAELAEAAERLEAGSGPIAIDTERASGFRYSGRAYLIQLRRAGAGSVLVDPIPIDDLEPLRHALTGPEWILHAASQDLPCLEELELRPTRLFDTELAARLCNFEKVGLASITEQLLGFRLEKQHSAADWSSRPLPHDWLVYAALDVELLIEMRGKLAAELAKQGKTEWAEAEFEHVRGAGPPKPRKEPWRRTSGIHKVRGPKALGRVRAVWEARDGLARKLDRAPGKVLPDAAIVEAATNDPTDFAELMSLPGFRRRGGRTNARLWLAALSEARDVPGTELPSTTPPQDGPPATHRWADRDPVAAERLSVARELVAKVAEQHNLPAENLITPAIVRGLAWEPPKKASEKHIRATLSEAGARQWQIDLLAEGLAEALG